MKIILTNFSAQQDTLRTNENLQMLTFFLDNTFDSFGDKSDINHKIAILETKKLQVSQANFFSTLLLSPTNSKGTKF